MSKFYAHKNFGGFSQEEETFLTFDKWKIFYEADPVNWFYIKTTGSTSWSKYVDVYFPVYHKSNGKKQYIKFLTKRDYKKYLKYIKNLFNTGENYSNLQEVMELATEISKRAEEHTIAAQQETQKLYDKYKVALEKASLDLSK